MSEATLIGIDLAKRRDKKAALRYLEKAAKKHGQTEALVTDGPRSYGAALKNFGVADR